MPEVDSTAKMAVGEQRQLPQKSAANAKVFTDDKK
jgi:hypothetical protein